MGRGDLTETERNRLESYCRVAVRVVLFGGLAKDRPYPGSTMVTRGGTRCGLPADQQRGQCRQLDASGEQCRVGRGRPSRLRRPRRAVNAEGEVAQAGHGAREVADGRRRGTSLGDGMSVSYRAPAGPVRGASPLCARPLSRPGEGAACWLSTMVAKGRIRPRVSLSSGQRSGGRGGLLGRWAVILADRWQGCGQVAAVGRDDVLDSA